MQSFYEADELTVRETADPVPGQGDLLLKTLSTAICASDVHFMDNPEVAESTIRRDGRCTTPIATS